MTGKGITAARRVWPLTGGWLPALANGEAIRAIFVAGMISAGSPDVSAADTLPPQGVSGQEMVHQQPHHALQSCQAESSSQRGGAEDTIGAVLFEGVQIETSDIKRYQLFFETILNVPMVEQFDHPGTDSLRGYCYRGVRIVVRQDFRAQRPTGWVQLNFVVPDVKVVQDEFDRAYEASSVSKLDESERNAVVRFRLKPDVRRGDRRVIRLEVFGPEGFMIGFNQYK